MILGLVIGIAIGIIMTLLVMLVLFAVGYNTIGTLLQIFKPDIFIPTIKQLQETRNNDN